MIEVPFFLLFGFREGTPEEKVQIWGFGILALGLKRFWLHG